MFINIIMDSLIDSVKLLPFLFLTYLLMEMLEHRTGAAAREKIKKAGKSGPVWGGLLGVLPQCGFSTAASSLYAGKIITVGTLTAVYLSTSDEMLPILISNAVPAGTIAGILTWKVAIAVVSGLLVDIIYRKVIRKEEKEINVHAVCEAEHCHCEHGIWSSAFSHTVKIFVYIFLLSFLLNAVIGLIGEDTLAGVFTAIPVIGEIVAALVGMIPNCASSVVITQLYLEKIIGAGPMMAGLLVNAGVGFLVLFRLNKDKKQNLGIAAMIFCLGVFWGVLIEMMGIVF